jgi:prepilin-type N-terminal cleavage/methylation domain-containing protein
MSANSVGQRGFSLLEALIAIAIVSTSIVAGLAAFSAERARPPNWKRSPRRPSRD